MANNAKHPVWSVYDLYRDARLNVKYYSTKLHRLSEFNLFLEILILDNDALVSKCFSINSENKKISDTTPAKIYTFALKSVILNAFRISA